MAKICIICNEDCSNEPRFKNEDGHYVCARCHATQQDNDQQQVDDTEARTPRWAVFYGHFVGYSLFLGIAALICAMSFGPKSWFPYQHSGDTWLLAIIGTGLYLMMSTIDQRFLSYFIKILLFAPVASGLGYTDNNILRGLCLIWIAIIGLYTHHDFTKDRDDDDGG